MFSKTNGQNEREVFFNLLFREQNQERKKEKIQENKKIKIIKVDSHSQHS